MPLRLHRPWGRTQPLHLLMRAGRTFPRWVPTVAAAPALLQLAGIPHLAASPHGICREHGMVVDLESAPSESEAVALLARAGLDPAPGPIVQSDSHPHCPALWVLRAARTESCARSLVLACTEREPHSGAFPCASAADGWMLRRAPKQSPPV